MTDKRISSSNNHHLSWAWGLVVFVLPVLLSIPFLMEPLARDQGYFAYGGWRILHGELPYAGFWANTFPGIFWWYALMRMVAGGTFLGHALWNGIAIGGTSLALLRLRSGLAGRIAALGYGISVTLLHRFWDLAQAEQLMALFLVWSIYFTWAARKPFVSGILLGGAILTKPTALLFLPLFWGHGKKLRPFFLGMATAFLLLLLPYIVSGGFRALMECLFVFNSGYGASRWDCSLFGRASAHLGRWMISLWPAVVIAFTAMVFRWKDVRRTVLWWALALAGVLAQGKFFSYHWVVLLAPLMLLFGAGVREGLRRQTAERWAIAALVVLPLFPARNHLLKVWYPAYHEARIGLNSLFASVEEENYLDQFGNKAEGSDFSAKEQWQLSVLLKNRPGKTLLVWGFEAGINYLCEKPCPVRHIVDFPLTFQGKGRRASQLRDDARVVFMAEMRKQPPELIVVVKEDQNPVEAEDSYAQILSFPEFKALLEEQYQLTDDVGVSYLIYERKS